MSVMNFLGSDIVWLFKGSRRLDRFYGSIELTHKYVEYRVETRSQSLMKCGKSEKKSRTEDRDFIPSGLHQDLSYLAPGERSLFLKH